MTNYSTESFTVAYPSFGGTNSWTLLSGTWANEGGGWATVNLGGDFAATRMDSSAPSADMSTTATLHSIPPGRSFGVLARMDNSSTALATASFYGADFHFDTSTVYILGCIGGSVNPITSFSFTPPSLPCTLSVSVYGTDIRAYVNGTQVGSTVTDSSVTTGNRGGLDAYNSNGDVEFSNFSLDSALQAPSAINGSATLAATSSMTSAGIRNAQGAASLSEATSISAAAIQTVKIAATLTATDTMSAAAQQTWQGTATLAATSSIQATGVPDRIATLAAASALSATAIRNARGTGTLAQASTLSAIGATMLFAESFPAAFPLFGGDLAWTEIADVWANLGGGVATCGAQGVVGAVRAERDTPTADMTVVATVSSLNPSRSVGLMARVSTAGTSLTNTNFYAVEVKWDAQTVTLLKGVAGTITVVGTTPISFTLPFVMGLSVVGSQINITVGGNIVASFVDTSITTGTRAGLWCFNGNGDVLISDFRVTTAVLQTVLHPTGLAQSGGGFGSPTLSAQSVTVTPTGLSQIAVPGFPAMSGAITVTATGIAQTGGGVGSPAVSGETWTRPASITSLITAGTPGVHGVDHVGPTGIAGTPALGTPQIHTATTTHPTGVASTAALGTTDIQPGPATTRPVGATSQIAFGDPSIDTTVTSHPTGLATSSAPGVPVLDSLVTVRPTAVSDSPAVGTPALSGSTRITPKYVIATVLGLPTLRYRRYVTVAGIPSAMTTGSPRISGTTRLQPAGVAPTAVYGSPVLTRVWRLRPSGIAAIESLGSPVLSGQTTVHPHPVADYPRLGSPTVTAEPLAVVPTGIPSGIALGTLTAARKAVTEPYGRIRLTSTVTNYMDE